MFTLETVLARNLDRDVSETTLRLEYDTVNDILKKCKPLATHWTAMLRPPCFDNVVVCHLVMTNEDENPLALAFDIGVPPNAIDQSGAINPEMPVVFKSYRRGHASAAARCEKDNV